MKQFILKEFSSSLITHVSTSWEMSDSPSFSNIIDSVYQSTVYKDTWFANISQLPGTTLYVRAKRHFDNGEDSDWIPYEEVLSSVSDINYVVTEHSVEMPSLINSSFIQVNLDLIRIELAPPNLGGVAHIATNYIIKNLNGDIVYKSIYNTNDLTFHEIYINNFNISKYEQLKLYVSYITENNTQSQFMEIDIIPEQYLVYPINSIENIIYNLDFTLQLSNGNNINYNLYIKDTENNEIVFERLNTNETKLLIQQYTLFPNKTYELTINEVNGDGNYAHVFTTQSEFKLYKKVSGDTFTAPVFKDSYINLPIDINNYSIKGLGNNVILTYIKNNNNRFYINVINKTYNTYFETYLTSPIEFSYDLLNTQPIGNNRAICISTNGDNSGKLIFTILSYSINTYLLNLYRQDSIDLLYDPNKISSSSFIYNGYNRSIYFLAIDQTTSNVVLYKYLIETGDILNLVELPNQNFEKYFMFEYDIDKVYISATGLDTAGNNSPIYIYNTKTEVLTIDSVLDQTFTNSTLEFIYSRNGYAIGVDTSESTQDLFVFDIENASISTISGDQSMIDISSRIIQLNNYATFIKSNSDPLLFKYAELT